MESNEEVVETQTTDEGKTPAPSQEKRSPEDTAAFNLKRQAEKAKELGLDPAEILGVKTHIDTNVDDEDSKPVTVGMLRDIQKKDAQISALQLADGIADEEIKNATKEYLTNNITPSGDADKDFRIALAAASASKNKQVVEMMGTYIAPKRTAAGGSAGVKVDEEFVPTQEEQVFMRPPYNLTKEKILAARITKQ